MALNLKTDDWINNNKINTHDILLINKGLLVKIANNYERFWVKITEVNEKYILGSIDNHLSFNENYDYNDIIIFEKSNILDIHTSDNTSLINHHFKNDCLIKSKKKKNQ